MNSTNSSKSVTTTTLAQEDLRVELGLPEGAEITSAAASPDSDGMPQVTIGWVIRN